MSAPSASSVLRGERGRLLGGFAREEHVIVGTHARTRAFDALTATHCVAAVALGLADSLFRALTYATDVLPRGSVVVGAVALLAMIGTTVAVDRAGYHKSAWALLLLTYVVLLLFGVDQPSTAGNVVVPQIMAHCLVFAVAIADRATDRGASGRLTYVAAGVAGIAVGALLWGVVVNLGADLLTDDVAGHTASPRFLVVHPLYVALHWLLFGGAAVLFYGERRVALITLERLRAAELQRIARSREVIQSKLQAMQARVEPQFLFNTLADLRALYRFDASLAERMLDELVAFLRAAMPHMRDTSSTVAREAELVRAYLGIVRICCGDRLDFSIDTPADVATARLPSMMLLPLVDCALVHGLRPTYDGRKLSIRASVVDDRLRVAIGGTGARFGTRADGSAIACIRERLAALYGARARLSVRCLPTGGIEALMETPYEVAG
jgi:hypothetical protein